MGYSPAREGVVSALFTALCESETKESLAAMVCKLREEIGILHVVGDADLMELVQLYKARWLECVTPEEAQRLRDEIERLRQFEPSPAEQAQMKLNKEARDRRKAAGYDDDAWRKPGE